MDCVEGSKCESSSLMAPSTTSSSIIISLHPLVIMNIAEHWTRIRAQQGKTSQVYGALLGRQKGRNVEFCTSFEIKMLDNNGNEDIDIEFLNTCIGQYKQIYSDFDFLGWYTTGGLPNENDLRLHKQICTVNESPILLKLDPFGKHTDLPVSIYESIIEIVDGQVKMLFIESEFILSTEEAERIGVDHIAKHSCGDTMIQSTIAEHLNAQYSAISLLNNRIKIILEYVKGIKENKLRKNNNVLREIRGLCHRLPVISSNDFNKEFYTQYNDVLWISYLGVLMQSSNILNQYISKFLVMHDKTIAKREEVLSRDIPTAETAVKSYRIRIEEGYT